MHELSLSGAIVNTVVKHAAGRPVSLVSLRVGALRQVVPDTLEFYFEFVSGTVCESARLEQADPGAAALRALRREGDRPAIFMCPNAARWPGRGRERREFEVVHRGRGDECMHKG